jgi:hypothetical protein
MDPYIAGFEGLVDIHRRIAVAFDDAIAAPTDLTLAKRAGTFLLAHHTLESEVLFPILRREGRLRSADVSFLDPFDRAHHELHGLCERLLVAGPGSVGSLARTIREVLFDHVADEERGMTPERMRTLISIEGLDEVQRRGDELRERLQAGLRNQ